ncbi:DUF2852 domain-containing protein [Aestuariivirga litoralis]|uniref:DUF2852 domain-containing protein n=1 Tax=Aestuariivirga litoralis TaxID=2650924 RepID=UPI0018C75462|nr:DUF2852 domain-containing protein [Aestuariivirga litoralis]
MNNSAYASAEDGGRGSSWGARSGKKPWSVYEIAAVVGGFAVFWPIGLGALFLRYKNGEVWKGASEMQAPWSQWKSPKDAADHFAKATSGWKNRTWSAYSSTGNEAFDEYRRAKLEELEAMKRKLDEERQAFDEYLTKLRKAKDREDFERFVAERNVPSTRED